MLRWVLRAAVLLLPGCFHPVYEHLACGAGDTCPSGQACNTMSGFCERPGAGPPGGADAGTGPDGGTGGPASCLQRWLDGGPGLALAPPQALAITSLQFEDRDPWISADGTRMYFDRKPGSKGASDIYAATRASTAGDFTAASAVENLDTNDEELRAALTGDEKLLVFSANHNAGARFQLVVSTRSSMAEPFSSPAAADQALIASVNTANDSYYDPFLSQDGLRLYVAPMLSGQPQQIGLATRAAGGNFGPAAAVRVINSTGGDADPALSLDERILVFSSLRPAGTGLARTNLWYATRPTAAADFAPPQLIPTVNSDANEGDPFLSADGCELYFSSTRSDGKYHMFRARLMN